ncbi:chaplin family protein [Streptomyces sp. NPDC059900]|uniref:chaplin family protein n=1 Tax=Streptomyces sp. NPDC059900 TaxID=3155816 RepID=UPI003418393F
MKSLYLALPACFAAGVGLIGATCAQADSGAQGAAQGSPGAVSGNLAQLPLHVPANVCGNTVDVVGLLNPAFGNQCANAGAHAHGPSGATGQEGPKGQEGTDGAFGPQGAPQGSAAQPQHPSGYGDDGDAGPAQEADGGRPGNAGAQPQRPSGYGDDGDVGPAQEDDGRGPVQRPGDDAGKPQRPGDDAKPEHHGSTQAPKAAPSATPADGGAHREHLSREQGPEAGRPGTISPGDSRPSGLTPVASGHGAGPSAVGEAAAPGSPALAETGAEDGLGLTALAAVGMTGAGAVMARGARSSRR